MSAPEIQLDSRDGITLVTINRPHKRNAMTAQMCDDMAIAWQRFRDSDDRVAVLHGAGEAFSAGADLNQPPSNFWRALPEVGIQIGKPVIAAVRGPAVGFGLAMVVFSDLAVAAEDARFIYPEGRIGVTKGLMAALSVRVPLKIANEIMLLGKPIDAKRAYEAGLVNQMARLGCELNDAMRMAGDLGKAAPMVIRLLKKMARETLPVSPAEAAYRAQLDVEAVEQSADAQAGLEAFRNRKTPVFAGH
ncbi:enoyl-CoA hydratase/isomerase family protein [Ottowia thiooxydans]|uniref:enoyl-CoA hydratase/isomerase family protein n=1 Tax=Ottowia thiooxydans TaxID=219182 RepID=UPI00041D4336|nr:enoyl-CoA hydratase/isomerase family protein [Ottowia thiooxydans]